MQQNSLESPYFISWGRKKSDESENDSGGKSLPVIRFLDEQSLTGQKGVFTSRRSRCDWWLHYSAFER